jgi:hypothetical protein
MQVPECAARALCNQAPQRGASLRTTLYNEHAAGHGDGREIVQLSRPLVVHL